jgi:cyclophilin family peptidyl-prolyl cis-trans isomerase
MRSLLFLATLCLLASTSSATELAELATEAAKGKLDATARLLSEYGVSRTKALEARKALEALKSEGAKKLLEQPALSANNPRVRIVLPNGNIEIVLLEDAAPNTVANFIQLIEKKFFDGLTFHRVIQKFMAQGGDPTGTGGGGPGYSFADEINADALGLDKMTVKELAQKCGQRPPPPQIANMKVKALYERNGYKYTPGLPSYPMKRGVLAMANAGPNTNGSQFFLTHIDCPWLNGKHTVFGVITAGQSLVDNMKANEKIGRIEVLYKRDHPYKVKKLGE